MRRAHPGVALGSLALALFAGVAGHRSFPDTAPNDPDYDRWERGVDSSSFYDEQWNLYSFTPRGVALTRQASGISADLAWRISTGRRDVTVAILDSGIRWDERELVNQLYLNRGELPEPQDAQGRSRPGVYDLNGDGVFNIQDYAADRRFWDVNGNGILDPGDLIALASDGVDSDGNGYVTTSVDGTSSSRTTTLSTTRTSVTGPAARRKRSPRATTASAGSGLLPTRRYFQ